MEISGFKWSGTGLFSSASVIVNIKALQRPTGNDIKLSIQPNAQKLTIFGEFSAGGRMICLALALASYLMSSCLGGVGVKWGGGSSPPAPQQPWSSRPAALFL